MIDHDDARNQIRWCCFDKKMHSITLGSASIKTQSESTRPAGLTSSAPLLPRHVIYIWSQIWLTLFLSLQKKSCSFEEINKFFYKYEYCPAKLSLRSFVSFSEAMFSLGSLNYIHGLFVCMDAHSDNFFHQNAIRQSKTVITEEKWIPTMNNYDSRTRTNNSHLTLFAFKWRPQ